jgi:hypothetical protein
MHFTMTTMLLLLMMNTWVAAPAGQDCAALSYFRHVDQYGFATHHYVPPTPMVIADTVTLANGESFRVSPYLYNCDWDQGTEAEMVITKDNVIVGSYAPGTHVDLSEPGHYRFSWQQLSPGIYHYVYNYVLRHQSELITSIPVYGVSRSPGQLHVSARTPTTVAATLICSNGSVVASWSNLPVSPEPTPLPVPGRAVGAYLLVIQSERGREVHKVWLE